MTLLPIEKKRKLDPCFNSRQILNVKKQALKLEMRQRTVS